MKKDLTITKTKTVGKYLSLSTSKLRLIISGAITAILLLLILINTADFFKEGVANGISLFVTSVIATLISGGLLTCKWDLTGWAKSITNLLSIVALPIITMSMVECLNGVSIRDWSLRAIIMNVLIYSLIYMAIYTLSGSRRLPFLITTPLYLIISLVNYFVFEFRGTPFTPFDLMAASTAATVAESYKFVIGYEIVVSIVLAVFVCTVAWQITSKKNSIKKIIARVLVGLMPLAFFASYYTSDAIANIGFSPDFFDQARGYHETGVVPSFLFNTKYIAVKAPEGYNRNEIKDIVYKVIGDTDNDSNTKSQKSPNLICIMNETLADYSKIGNLKTNKDCLPFLHSMSENTIQGTLYVPVIGAGTSNTEFEFLTGTTTAFMPTGSNAYTLYVKNEIPTLTNVLKSQNYSARAFHPFFENNWNRVNVYNYMGFEKYDGMESFFNDDIMNAYKNGATYEELKKMVDEQFGEDNKVLLRDVVSDTFDYKKVIEMYEERDKDQPFYIFNITMQNHGGYEDSFPDFNEEVYLVNNKGEKRTEFPQTNQYLSLLYESDKAFNELVTYFEVQEEPTMILMFGDHQPKVETEFYEEIHDATSLFELTREQAQERYETPFYIWANYDIEETEVKRLSTNYLSSYLLKTAGLEMSLFNQYLIKLSEKIPVIDTVGYIDANDNYHLYEENTEYTELINDYKKVCYYYLFDKNADKDWLFSIKS